MPALNYKSLYQQGRNVIICLQRQQFHLGTRDNVEFVTHFEKCVTKFFILLKYRFLSKCYEALRKKVETDHLQHCNIYCLMQSVIIYSSHNGISL